MKVSKRLSVSLQTLVLCTFLVGTGPSNAGEAIENASPEILVSGPDNLELGTSVAFPDSAVDDQGRRIHVWENFGNPGGIAMRRFDSAGNPLEDPRLIVPDVGPSNPQRPRLAVAADGSFMVIWQSSEDLGSGSLERWIRGQLFDSDGVAMGSPQIVSTIAAGPSGIISDSDIAALRLPDGTSGGFVAVWKSEYENPAGTDNSSSSIQAQRLTAAGVPTGDQIEVNTTIQSGQRKPSVSEMADGGFVVVWIEPDLHGQRFNSAGAPIAGQFQINTAFSSIMDEPDVAIGWDGEILVVWEDPETFANSTEIRARIYDSDLNAMGPDFRVNTVVVEAQDIPRVGDLGPNGFLVTWESRISSAGSDVDGESVQARIVTGPNAFDGPQVQLNLWGDGGQEAPSSHGWYGRTTSNWDGDGNASDPPPGNTEHVMARDIEYCLFCDDFEWFDPASVGSLWRWSGSLGAN